MSRDRRASFVVRVVENGRGQIGGVIERVATGAKEAFRGLEAVGRVLGDMLREERPRPPIPSGPTGSSDPTTGLPERPRAGPGRRAGRRR